MRTSAFILLLALAAPLAAADGFGHARDQSWSPRGTGVPDLWVPHDLVQGETALLMVIEFPRTSARVEVLDGDAVLFAQDATLTSQGSGHYGEVQWPVPRDLAPGNYTVRATDGDVGVEATARVWEGPHLFAGDAPRAFGDVVWLEAVGFDAAPATGVVLQEGLRWEVAWPDARGEPRGAEANGVARAPGADEPRRVVGGGDGHESVMLAPRALSDGDAWFNGTFGGAPRTLHIAWTLEREGDAPWLWVEPTVPATQLVEVVGLGWGASVTLRLGNVTRHVETAGGFFEALVAAPEAQGPATLVVEDGAAERSVPVDVGPTPQVVAEHAHIPLPAALVVLALASAAHGRRPKNGRSGSGARSK